MRYAFIQASLEDSELKDIPIAKRCEVLEVSVSGYHAWVKRQRMPVKCKKVISDETVLRQAKIIRNEMKYTPGYRQMHALMRQRGVCIGVKRLRGVLRVNGIIGYRHFKRTVKTTDSNHNMFVYPNLLGRDFAPGTLNRAWVSDITYLPTTQGWGFLATILDLGSRRILGWAMDTSMTTDLVLRALNMAVRTRGSNAVAGTIMHSDRGTQYCSAAFQNRLAKSSLFRGGFQSFRGDLHSNDPNGINFQNLWHSWFFTGYFYVQRRHETSPSGKRRLVHRLIGRSPS